MGYYEHLCALLAPMGVYRTETDSLSGAELFAAGAGLDAAAERLERVQREAICETAEEDGLSLRERLFARCPVRVNAELRRAAIEALMRINTDGFTPAAINAALIGCGIAAQAEETDSVGAVRVTFPGTAGVPDDFTQIESIILGILPCHLTAEFFFRFITWAECESAGYTWRRAAEHTWESFQKAVGA